MKTTFIGIDFGTTKTLVSCYNAVQRDVKIIRLGRGRDDLPTSIYAAEDGSFLCGEDAEDMCAMEPTRYARAFKMKLGSDDSVLAFFDAVSGDLVGHKASTLAVEYLRGIRTECSRLQGGEVVGAVITRPVRFSPIQCKQLEDAAYAAGFAELRFITEPEAAAHTFCRDNEGEGFRNALIIDWGGGTLDMALVSRQGEQLRTYSQYTDGLLIGGESFDDALLRHVVEQLKAGGVDITPDLMNPEFSYTIRRKIRQAKEMLSKLPQVPLRLSGSGGAYPAVTVKREDFIGLIRPQIELAAGLARRLINSIAELSLKPEMMILVGGSSRIPAIAEILEQQVGLPCRTWDMSMEAVGLGAALVMRANVDTPLPDDPEELRRAAEQGNAEAQYALANRYADGNGVPQDFAEAFKWYKLAAEQGNAKAQSSLGECYANGKGVEQSLVEAFKWYNLAAGQGQQEAQNVLGEYHCDDPIAERSYEEWYKKMVKAGITGGQNNSGGYYYGQGIKQSDEEATRWYRMTAEQGHRWAQAELGMCYEKGRGVEQDYAEAAKWYKLAAGGGHAGAQNNLGKCYENGWGVEQSYTEALKWYNLAADQGFAAAQYNLGACYAAGWGVEQSDAEAVKWYKLAADKGYAEAQNKLGVCSANGWGVEQSDAEAVKWYKLAAERGYATAQDNLGKCYEKGWGVEQSYAEAAKWYKLAAEQGDDWAQCNLAACYYNGLGVEKSSTEAAKWYKLAAEQGNAPAQYNLGFCYENGLGVEQSYEEAAEWYELAAEQGNAWAQCNLGVCYENGMGVPQDFAVAFEWYKQAAGQGHAEAQERLRAFSGSLLIEKRLNGFNMTDLVLTCMDGCLCNMVLRKGNGYEADLGTFSKGDCKEVSYRSFRDNRGVEPYDYISIMCDGCNEVQLNVADVGNGKIIELAVDLGYAEAQESLQDFSGRLLIEKRLNRFNMTDLVLTCLDGWLCNMVLRKGNGYEADLGTFSKGDSKVISYRSFRDNRGVEPYDYISIMCDGCNEVQLNVADVGNGKIIDFA